MFEKKEKIFVLHSCEPTRANLSKKTSLFLWDLVHIINILSKTYLNNSNCNFDQNYFSSFLEDCNEFYL